MNNNMILHGASLILVLVGGLNWGLVGLFNVNLVNLIFGGVPMLETLVYVLVGLSAVYIAVTHKSQCKLCETAMKKS